MALVVILALTTCRVDMPYCNSMPQALYMLSAWSCSSRRRTSKLLEYETSCKDYFSNTLLAVHAMAMGLCTCLNLGKSRSNKRVRCNK